MAGIAIGIPIGDNAAADFHPQAARRCAPSNLRLIQTVVSAGKVTSPIAVYPQPR